MSLRYDMKILFVCTGNTCRSPMAQGIAQNIAFQKNFDYKITSAGIMVDSKSGVSVFSAMALKDFNIDISSHKPIQLTFNHLKDADIALTMTKSQKELLINAAPQFKDKIKSLGEYSFQGDIADPYGCDFSTYKNCALQIKEAVQNLYERINLNE